MKKEQQILLDMDGVLVDFVSGAISALNRDFNTDITIERYVKEFGLWEMYDYYGISIKQFWESIHNTPDFWYNLRPFPWYEELYNFLSTLGRVTIVTTPSVDPSCAEQKLRWLRNYMGIDSTQVLMGARKSLLAGNGILIDDYASNVEKFKSCGGEAILIPSNWNTNGLTFERIKNTILNRQ